MNVILASVKWDHDFAYIHGIFLLNAPDHQPKHIDESIRLLLEFRITVKLGKSHVYSRSIKYSCHVLVPRTLQMTEKITEADKVLQYPANIFSAQTFQELCIVYKRLLLSFNCLSAPLKKKLNAEELLNSC